MRTYNSIVYGAASDADLLAGKWYEIGCVLKGCRDSTYSFIRQQKSRERELITSYLVRFSHFFQRLKGLQNLRVSQFLPASGINTRL